MNSEGNGTILLLVDSANAAEYKNVDETMLSAFRHLGIPYMMWDVGRQKCPSADELLKHSCVVLGQDHLGRKLGKTGAEALRDAVKNGVGLVSFDGDLGNGQAFVEIFNMHAGRAPRLCSGIKTVNAEHYITGTRELNDDIALKNPVEVWPVESLSCGCSATSLLQAFNNWPLVMADTYGRGRIVFFTTTVKLWTREVLGHASGLDDVFWKAIVWAARKPFAIYAMPPMATSLIDDCSGSYNHFRYVDVMNKYGWIPHLEVYLEDIDRVMHDELHSSAKKIKGLYDAGLAEFGVHGFTYDKLMWFDHKKRKSLSDRQIAENFKQYDAYLKKWGIKPSRYENPHFSEMGRNALPYLKERGVEYLSFALNLDTAWLDVPHKKPVFVPPLPYHHHGYYMDYLKEDRNFFIVASKLRPWRLESSDFTPETDFLWDNTVFWDESPSNNVEAAARVGVKQVRRGIDARFFGTLLCHEQRIAVVSPREWEEMFRRIHDGLRKYNLLYRPFEYICDYARSHHDTRISAVSINHASGKVHCELQGSTCLTTALEVYTNEDNGVRCRLCDVPRFSGKKSVEI